MKLPAREENVTRADLQARILRQMEGYFPEGYGLKEGRALAALGALPTAEDTLAQRAAWWTQFLGAWYDPETDTMLVSLDEQGRTIVENHRRGVAFALLSAVRARRLAPKDSRRRARTDAWLARLSLLAGDAASRRPFMHRPRILRTRKTQVVLLPLPAAVPRDFLAGSSKLGHASNAGENFVKASHHLGDFDQVNATYERPPVATAELMDPGLYFSEEQFEPRIPAWVDVKVSVQTPFWDDTLGELGLRLFLWQGLPQQVAEEAAAGWRGDRWLAYDAGDNTRGQVAWQTLWKDKTAADKFYAAMQRLLRAKHPESPAPAGGPGPWKWSADGPQRYHPGTHGWRPGCVLRGRARPRRSLRRRFGKNSCRREKVGDASPLRSRSMVP